MVGDDIRTAIAGAQGCSFRGVLARTGKYWEDRIEEAGVRLYAIIDSIADLPGLIGR